MTTAKKAPAKRTSGTTAAAAKKGASRTRANVNAAGSKPAAKHSADETVKKVTAKKAVRKSAPIKGAAKKAPGTRTPGRRYSPQASEDVRQELHEMKRGQLHIGRSKEKVTNPKQAIAIGLAKARREGAKVPPNPNTAR